MSAARVPEVMLLLEGRAVYRRNPWLWCQCHCYLTPPSMFQKMWASDCDVLPRHLGTPTSLIMDFRTTGYSRSEIILVYHVKRATVFDDKDGLIRSSGDTCHSTFM